jgi:glycosyltransferase involved in cell wall biosynthesis
MHKFTILTSLYKSRPFLKNYFNTIFSQLILPDEIVLVDDTKNPDDLEEIIKKQKIKYKFNKIILERNSENCGPTISLNKGLSKCSNNLIFRLDVDDLWLPNHTKKTLEYYEKDKNFLIYSNTLKRKNILTNIKCDEYFINENHLIHSSWLINRNICKNFRYRMNRPSVALEDYYTLLYYKWKKYRIFFSYDITTIYTENLSSHGRNHIKNKKYINIRKKISLLFFLLNLKYKTLFEKIYFILFKYGLLKFAVLMLWILDYLMIKRSFNYINDIISKKK